MLGVPLLYLNGIGIITFQLSGAYCIVVPDGTLLTDDTLIALLRPGGHDSAIRVPGVQALLAPFFRV